MMVLMMILIDIDDEDLEDLRMRMTVMSIPSGILEIYTVIPLIQDLPCCYKIFFGDSVDGSHEDTPSESPLPSGVNLRGQMSTYETLPMVFETCLRFIFFGLKMGLLTKRVQRSTLVKAILLLRSSMALQEFKLLNDDMIVDSSG